MVKLAVIFHSVMGTIKQLARAVAAGASSVEGIEVINVEILGADIIEGRFKNSALLKKLTDVDAMVFGSPTLYGQCVGTI